MFTQWRGALISICLCLLGACAVAPEPRQPAEPAWVGWEPQTLPGKTSTRYEPGHKGGRPAVHARAERSVSLWRKRFTKPVKTAHEVSFGWWLDEHLAGADISQAGATDAPVRVMVAFGGDVSLLPLRTRMMMDLAQALTGEEPPYATLVYVWDRQRTLESVVQHPRSDRIRKIVVETGDAHLGRWRHYRRDLRADYRRAFGEDPGPVLGVMIMTDSDNTASTAQAWYGPVQLN